MLHRSRTRYPQWRKEPAYFLATSIQGRRPEILHEGVRFLSVDRACKYTYTYMTDSQNLRLISARARPECTYRAQDCILLYDRPRHLLGVREALPVVFQDIRENGPANSIPFVVEQRLCHLCFPWPIRGDGRNEERGSAKSAKHLLRQRYGSASMSMKGSSAGSCQGMNVIMVDCLPRCTAGVLLATGRYHYELTCEPIDPHWEMYRGTASME